MSFVPGNRLEEAMVQAVDDTAARPVFYHLLLESELFVIGDVDGRPESQGEIALKETDSLSIAALAYQGENYHPVFSSEGRLRTFVGEQVVRFFSIQGRALFECARGAAFLLNPGSALSKILTAKELEYVLSQPMQDASTNITLTQPKVYPKKLVQALCVLFMSRSQVVTAHLSYVSRQGDGGEPHPLLAIVAEGDLQNLVQEIFAAANVAMPSTIIDIIGIDPKAKLDPFRNQLVGIAPFYRRMLPATSF